MWVDDKRRLSSTTLKLIDRIPERHIQGSSRSQCTDLAVSVAAELRLTVHRGDQSQPYKLKLIIGV